MVSKLSKIKCNRRFETGNSVIVGLFYLQVLIKDIPAAMYPYLCATNTSLHEPLFI